MEILGIDLLRAVIAAAALVAIFWVVTVIFRHYQTGTLPPRLRQMFRRVGLSVDDVTGSDLETHLPTASRLCHSCKSVRACDEWLAQQEQTSPPPRFCPNGGYLQLVKDERVTR